jgi:hypothetical protein
VSNCTGDGQDGTPTEACTAVQHNVQTNGHSILDGINTLVNVSSGGVRHFPDPFAHQARPSSFMSSGRTF